MHIYILADLARLYPLEPRIGGVEQTQTSHEPKLRKNPNFEQTQKFLALGGLRIIRR